MSCNFLLSICAELKLSYPVIQQQHPLKALPVHRAVKRVRGDYQEDKGPSRNRPRVSGPHRNTLRRVDAQEAEHDRLCKAEERNKVEIRHSLSPASDVSSNAMRPTLSANLRPGPLFAAPPAGDRGLSGPASTVDVSAPASHPPTSSSMFTARPSLLPTWRQSVPASLSLVPLAPLDPRLALALVSAIRVPAISKYSARGRKDARTGLFVSSSAAPPCSGPDTPAAHASGSNQTTELSTSAEATTNLAEPAAHNHQSLWAKFWPPSAFGLSSSRNRK